MLDRKKSMKTMAITMGKHRISNKSMKWFSEGRYESNKKIKDNHPPSPSPSTRKTKLIIFEVFLNTYNSMGPTPIVFVFLLHTYAKEIMFWESINTCHLMKDNGFFQVFRNVTPLFMLWEIWIKLRWFGKYINTCLFANIL